MNTEERENIMRELGLIRSRLLDASKNLTRAEEILAKVKE